MIAVLFLLLLAMPVLELWVIVEVAGRIGVPETLAALFVISALGAWLLKRQGMATWRRLQHTLREGRVPASEAVDGGLILLGGALLMTPGFVTDAAGVVLLLPPARAALKGAARRLLTLWAAKRLGLGGRVRTARVTRVVGSRRRLDPPSSR